VSLRPTRRLPGMLAAASTVYLFATNSQVIWLYLVAALIGALAVVGLLAPALAVRRLHPRLRGWTRTGFTPPLAQDRARVFAGDRLALALDLGEDRPPVHVTALRTNSVEIPADSGITGSTATVELLAGGRGELALTAMRMESSWPLGIGRAHRWVPLQLAVVVHPRYALPIDDRRQGTREPVGASSARGPGDEFLGLREYQSGDSQRRIHWPTSARTGTLMVIETAQESSNATSYELELAADAEEAAELAVGLAASLAAGNVAAGVPMAMSIPGSGRQVARWNEVLTGLALTRPGMAAPARRGRDAVRVSAAGRQVTVARGAETRVVDAGTALVDALAMIGDIR